ncbi:MAG: hypothetical protein RLZ72_962, partial [Actinomycetota bacterium]
SAYVDGRGWNGSKTVDSKDTYTKAELVDGDGSSPKRRNATSVKAKR